MDITFQTNYWLGFPESNSDILLNLTHWQYWWWFWFTYLLCLYYFFFLRLLKNRLLKFRPKIVTAYKARGKWGDFLVCLLPITWCINILSNSNFILRMLEWQTESSLFTIRIRGRQWYWVYKIEIKSLVTMTNLLKNLGHNYWVLFSTQKLNYLQDYATMLHIKNNKDILQSYGSEEFGFQQFNKKMQGKTHKTDNFFFKKKIKNLNILDSKNNNKKIFENLTKINFSNGRILNTKKFSFIKNTIIDDINLTEKQFVNILDKNNIFKKKITKINFKITIPGIKNPYFKETVTYRKFFPKNTFSNIKPNNTLLTPNYIKNYVKDALFINRKVKNNFWNSEFLKNKLTLKKVSLSFDVVIKRINILKNIEKINYLKNNFKDTITNLYLKSTWSYTPDKSTFNKIYKNSGILKSPYSIVKNKNYITKINFFSDFNKKKFVYKITNSFNASSINSAKKINKNSFYSYSDLQNNLFFKNKSKTIFSLNNLNNLTSGSNFLKLNDQEQFNKVININSFTYNYIERALRYNYFSKIRAIKINFFKKNFEVNFANINNNIFTDKNFENIYLVVKQKRLVPINKGKLLSKPTTLLLNNGNLSLFQDLNAKIKYIDYFKIAKNKPQNFSNMYYRRLLRTKRILVLPTNVNVTLITNSFDVVHSWYIPGLGIKLDCVPGRSTHHTINIDHAGFYYGQCAEICGRYHHHMPIRVCALPFEHFLVWWYHFGIPYFNSTKTTRKKSVKSGIRQYNW